MIKVVCKTTTETTQLIKVGLINIGWTYETGIPSCTTLTHMHECMCVMHIYVNPLSYSYQCISRQELKVLLLK